MALDTTVFARDLLNVINDMPATMTWSGQTITGMKSEGSKSHELEMDGPMPTYALTFQARVEDFTNSTLPNVGVRVTVDSTTYRISRREVGPASIQVTFELEDVNQ